MKHSYQNRILDVLQIGCYGHVPDEHQADEKEENWPHPNLTISGNPISRTIPATKLQDSGYSTFREIYRKSLHIISELTV